MVGFDLGWLRMLHLCKFLCGFAMRQDRLAPFALQTTNASLLGRPRLVCPVFRSVATHHDPFVRPPKVGSYIAGGVSQCQTASPSIGHVRLRPVQQQIGVDRCLACFQLDIDRQTISFDFRNRLVQHIRLILLAQLIRQMAEDMSSGNESHVGVPRIGVVDRQPHRHCLRWRERPVTCVLVPGDAFPIPWHFTEEVRPPPNHAGTEQIGYEGHDRGFVRMSHTRPCRRCLN